MVADSVDDVVRELRYCQWAGWAWHYAKGRPARAQDDALCVGWMAPHPSDQRRLIVTPEGKAEIARSGAR